MRLMKAFVALALLTSLGCSALHLGGTKVSYTAQVCLTGTVPVPCTNLGTVQVDSTGVAIAEYALTLAAPVLAQQADLKGCLFTSYPPVVNQSITITASAVCTLSGFPVNENVTVVLTPTS